MNSTASPEQTTHIRCTSRKAMSSEGRIGGPCAAVKSDRVFCSKKAVVVIDGRGYCSRHAKRMEEVAV